MQNNITKAFQERISEIMDNMSDHTRSFEITMRAAVDEPANITYKVNEYTTLEVLRDTGHWDEKEDADVKTEN